MFNILTIDVEEWYQTVLFNRDGYADNTRTDLPENVDAIFSLLQEFNVRATFFVVGNLVEKYPGLVRSIVRGGHEISSHGYGHRSVYDMTCAEFKEDVRLSVEKLKGESGGEIWGYRAPTWSITRSMSWAIDGLGSLGIKYDSSLYPFGWGRRKTESFPYVTSQGLMEFPPSTFRFCGCDLPFAGGSFLRFLPLAFIKKQIRGLNEKGRPAMIYFHPWEFLDKKPAIDVPKWKYAVQFSNADSVKLKIHNLLENFQFCSIRDYLRLL